MEKPKIKHLSNIELVHELPFCDELSVVEIYLANQALKICLKTF